MTDLASAAQIGIMTMNRFEGGEPVRAESQIKIRDALIKAGIDLIAAGDASADGGEGVRFLVSPQR